MLPKFTSKIPGPKSLKLAKELRKVECRNVTFVSPKFPVFWTRAKRQNVWDVDGNCFLDLSSGFGVSTAGFTPDWGVSAIQKQSAKLYHAMGDVHPTAQKVELCRLLSDITFERWKCGKAKIFLGNSGADAVETALKTAFLATGKKRIIAFEDSYHGLSFGALTVTGRRDFRDPFRKHLKDFATFVPFPTQTPSPTNPRSPWHGTKCLPALRDLLTKKIRASGAGAILVEPIQGRGGERIPPHGFLRMLREVADACKVLLIYDEIYTGFYRTGEFFACEHEGVYPDLLCLGKALSGGFPISACIGRAKWMDLWPESDGEAIHTSTFLGNPLGCALAIASLQNWQKKSPSVQAALAGQMWEQTLYPLQNLPTVGEVRGRGLLWGIELADRYGKALGALAGQTVEKGLSRGLILLSGGKYRNVISISPSLETSRGEAKFTASILEELLS